MNAWVGGKQVVPKGASRIRVQLSAAHSREQLDEAIYAFTSVGKELGIVPWDIGRGI